MAESKDLLQVLWSGADVLRGKMDANEYKTYLLGLIFYKYLSDSYLVSAYDLLTDEMPETLEEAQEILPELKIVKIDAEKTLNFTNDYNIQFYPEMLIFKDGKLVGTIDGYVKADVIVEAIKEYM